MYRGTPAHYMYMYRVHDQMLPIFDTLMGYTSELPTTLDVWLDDEGQQPGSDRVKWMYEPLLATLSAGGSLQWLRQKSRSEMCVCYQRTSSIQIQNLFSTDIHIPLDYTHTHTHK